MNKEVTVQFLVRVHAQVAGWILIVGWAGDSKLMILSLMIH